MGSGDPTNRFSANSNASLILLYCLNFRYFSTKNFDALEFAKNNIFGIGIHHTSLLGIWFAWTLSVLTLIFLKATRVMYISFICRYPDGNLVCIKAFNNGFPEQDGEEPS